MGDMCGKCSNNSREALHKKSSAEALNGEKIRTKKKDLPPNSSSKARQGQSRKKPGGSEGDLENGGDFEESDIEYDEHVEGNGNRRRPRAAHPSRRRGLTNRSGAAHSDRYSLSNYSS